MADTLTLPEKTRLRLVEASQAKEAAIVAANKAILTFNDLLDSIVEMAGLDSSLRNEVNLATGVITPAAPLPPPTPLHAEKSTEEPAEASG